MDNLNGNQTIIDELKKLNKLMGVLVTQGRSSGEKIMLLSQIGLTPKEIADTLGITPNLVSVTIHKEKKKIKKTK